MNNTDLTFEEKALKRANYALTSSIAFVGGLMILMYLGLIIQGFKVSRCLIIAAMIAAPTITSVILYVKNPLSRRFRYVAFGIFLIPFEVACLSSQIFIYNLFIYSVIITMIMYFDMHMEIRMGILALVLCILNGIYSYFVLGCRSRQQKNEIMMACTLAFILGICVSLAAKVAWLHRKEEMAEFAANRKMQEDMMNSIITIGHSVNSSTQSIHSLVEELTESTDSVNTAMSDVAVSMESTSASIQEQAEVAGRIQDIINETVEMTDELEKISRETRASVKAGQALVGNIVVQTEQIEQENTMVKDNMSQLHTHTKDMQKIIGIIQQISAQTNLLALNASIEAAHAGDAGKGFAVVAEEIRILAEQTKKSTESIEEIISKLDQNAADTIESMDLVMDKINGQVSMIHEIEEGFNGIRSGMSDLKENSIHMSEQIRTLKESNDSLVDSTNNLSSTSEEVSASAEETNAMCADNADRFKTINQVLTDLTAETARMDSLINEYHLIREKDDPGESIKIDATLHDAQLQPHMV